MKINTIYVAYNGEQNPYGIGSPCIVVRLQGCHIRCYKETLGILCDTPEALEMSSPVQALTPQQVVRHLVTVRKLTGVSLVLLTGGDPMARNPDELSEFFSALDAECFPCTVETSGTIDVSKWLSVPHVSFILDRKLKSAGVPHNIVERIAPKLRPQDYIKYVVYDKDDFDEMVASIESMTTEAKLCAGVYWNGPMNTTELFELLRSHRLLGKVLMNFQVHKLVTAVEHLSPKDLSTIQVPREI